MLEGKVSTKRSALNTLSANHGLSNHVDTKAKRRHLPVKGTLRQVFIKVTEWRYSLSLWYFLSSYVNCCPSSLLSGSTLSPPPFPVCILYTRIQCVRGGGLGPVLSLRQTNTCRKVPLQVNFSKWRHFTLPIAFYESYLSTPPIND